MTNAALEAEQMIAAYNQKLATVYRDQPFNRTAIATAFKACFKSADGVAYAELVEQFTRIDQIERKLEGIE